MAEILEAAEHGLGGVSILGNAKQEANIPLQMSKTFARQLRIIPCFRENESSLNNSLRVSSQTFGSPIIRDTALTASQFNVSL